MVGWHCWFNGHELGLTLGDSEGQGSLACCSSWGQRVGHSLANEQQQHIYICIWKVYYGYIHIHTQWNIARSYCSTSLIIRQMQINITMKFHLMPVRMLLSKRQQISICKDVKKRELLCTVGGNVKNKILLFVTIWMNVYDIMLKLK